MTMVDSALPSAAMLIALAIDRAFGEPPPRVHPVVVMGRYLGAFGSRLTALAPARAFAAGALAWSLCAAICVALAGWAGSPLWHWLRPWSSMPMAAVLALALGLLLKPLIAWRLLECEVLDVEEALARGIVAGRAQVARLASRDTSALDTQEVRETAIETLAENLNDSVVAPLFWFALAGLPGAALYRFANTADAMWGYRGRWEWAGKWAARADDVLSWLPARLTALALLPAPPRWHALTREARRTPSPNGGWPMGAMALALGVRLRKPGVYALNAAAPSPQPADTPRAIALQRRALAVCAALLLVLAAARSAVR